MPRTSGCSYARAMGDDTLVVNDKGESHITMEDYAVAIVDEAESPRHTGRRFMVGYWLVREAGMAVVDPAQRAPTTMASNGDITSAPRVLALPRPSGSC